jgi:drug/metabolite transporter (DMT)-like permease
MMNHKGAKAQRDHILPLIFISGISGGSVFPIIKLAEQYDIQKFSYIFWESFFIVLVLSMLAVVRKQAIIPQKNEVIYYIFCAFTNIIIPQSLFFIIAPNLPASIMGLIVILTPLLVYLSLVTMKAESFVTHKIIGVTLGFIGAACLFLPSLFQIDEQLKWFWVLFGLLLPINYAINRILATRFKPEESNQFRLAIGLFGCVSILTFILMMVFEIPYIPFQNLNGGDVALMLHVLAMVIFYLTFFTLADKGALQNSLASYLVPLVTLVWGMALFDEQISWVYLLSAPLIILGLYLTTKKTS